MADKEIKEFESENLRIVDRHERTMQESRRSAKESARVDGTVHTNRLEKSSRNPLIPQQNRSSQGENDRKEDNPYYLLPAAS
jgi:hypothetical protein